MWKSICGARVAQLQRRIWRIGDGKTVKIWGEPWVPSLHQIQPLPHLTPEVVEKLTINNLMMDNSNAWDAVKVRNIFLPHEAVAILKF